MGTPYKLTDLFQSRKFWALVFGLVTLGVSYQFGHVTLETVEIGVISLLSVYIGATALVDHGIALSQAAPPVTTINIPPQVTVTSSAISPISPILPISSRPTTPSSASNRSAEAVRILEDAGATDVRTIPHAGPPAQG